MLWMSWMLWLNGLCTCSITLRISLSFGSPCRIIVSRRKGVFGNLAAF